MQVRRSLGWFEHLPKIRCLVRSEIAVLAFVLGAISYEPAQSAPTRPVVRPFQNCTHIRSVFTEFTRGRTPIDMGALKPLVDWTDDDLEFIRNKIDNCANQGEISGQDGARFKAGLESIAPKLQAARAQREQNEAARVAGVEHVRQAQVAREDEKRQQEQASLADVHNSEMNVYNRMVQDLASFPPGGVKDLKSAISQLQGLRVEAFQHPKDAEGNNSTADAELEGKFAQIRGQVEARLDAYKRLLAQQASQATPVEVCVGHAIKILTNVPDGWLLKDSEIYFGAAPIAPVQFIQAGMGSGYEVTYNKPLLSDGEWLVFKDSSGDETVEIAFIHDDATERVSPVQGSVVLDVLQVDYHGKEIKPGSSNPEQAHIRDFLLGIFEKHAASTAAQLEAAQRDPAHNSHPALSLAIKAKELCPELIR